MQLCSVVRTGWRVLGHWARTDVGRMRRTQATSARAQRARRVGVIEACRSVSAASSPRRPGSNACVGGRRGGVGQVCERGFSTLPQGTRPCAGGCTPRLGKCSRAGSSPSSSLGPVLFLKSEVASSSPPAQAIRGPARAPLARRLDPAQRDASAWDGTFRPEEPQQGYVRVAQRTP